MKYCAIECTLNFGETGSWESWLVDACPILYFTCTQVYSRYPCEKPLIERVFVRTG